MPKTKRKRRFRPGRLILLVAALLVVIGMACAAWGYFSLKAPGDGNKEIEFEIKEGESFDSVLDSLQEQGMIRSAQTASLYAKMTHHQMYYAGVFLLSNDMSVKDILSTISDPDNAMDQSVKFTIPEGQWAKEIAANLSKQLPFTQKQILAQWNDETYIRTLAKDYEFLDPSVLDNDAIKVKLEGYLFPETYSIDRDATLDEVTRTFLDQFKRVYDKYKAQFASSGMSVEQVVTLASIIQFESGSVQDMKEISGVFHNRLAQDMKLESSVTVCYALYDDFNSPQDCETQIDIDSPYNTYQNSGLPVGPILNPGEDAIAAALEPNDNDYLFFAADIYNVKSDPGKVYYSTNYEDHEKLVHELNLVIE